MMCQEHLYPRVRRRVREQLNSYIQSPAVVQDNDTYIVPPGLGNRSGVLGAIALAERAASEEASI